MKRFFSILLCGALLLSCAVGCTEKRDAVDEAAFSAVVTIFPIYDWLRELLGERAEQWNITLLADNGADMHSYQPTISDIARIEDCDLFIYVGGISDAWAEDAIRQTENKDRLVLDLMELPGTRTVTEELAEGMEAPEDEEEEYDEHVWLSLRNAETFCAAITEALIRLDPEGKSAYEANLTAYTAALSALDEDFQAAVDAAPLKTLLFGDRFPFRYLTDDYGLNYYAAFSGCSAETEASFETIAFLSDRLKELDLPAVLILDSSDDRLAETIIRNAGVNAAVLTLDSMQSAAGRENGPGDTYISAMEQNLTVLKTALGRN